MQARRRPTARLVGLTAIAVLTGACASDGAGDGAVPRRRNVVLIVTDDQRWDSLVDMPRLDGSGEWARFDESFVHEPLCCPARATILTGRYSHRTGVETIRDGADLDERVTVATMLDDAGYLTGFYGKYLNGYPFGRGLYVPPGWDRFGAYVQATNYFDYTLNEDGDSVRYGSRDRDYSTTVFATKALEVVDLARDAQAPFFLYLALNAPHYSSQSRLAVPRPSDVGSCDDRPIAHRENVNARDAISEPTWMERARPVSLARMETAIRATCETLRGVDEAIQTIVDGLEERGVLDDTYLVFTSDNGYSFGEHRLVGKGHLYEESIRVPLLVRGPDVEASDVDRLTSNVDLVPTILEWAGVTPPAGFVDGTSFAPTLRGDRSGEPDAVLLYGCRTRRPGGVLASAEDEPVGSAVCGGYVEEMGTAWGVRTATHKLVEYDGGALQLFDLTRDPYELSNLADDPAQVGTVERLSERLAELRGA